MKRTKLGSIKGCSGYQPAWGVGDGVVAAASSSSAIKLSMTYRPTYQNAPSPSLARQQGHQPHAGKRFD